MVHDEKVTYIRFVFQGSALFEGRDDWNRYNIEESARKYAALCLQALEQEYPDAEVEVLDADIGGVLPGLMETQVNERSDSYEVDTVKQLCEDIYGRFEWQIPRQWLTIPEASQRFRVPFTTICWACKAGLIEEAEKIDARWAFPLDTFVELLDNKVLANCRGVMGIGFADDGAYRFECYSESILDISAADFPKDIETLLIIARNDFGSLWLSSADSSNVLVSKHGDQVDLLFEHFGSEISWASVWTYGIYAKALIAQARQRALDSKYDDGAFVVRFTFGSSYLYATLRTLITQAVDILGEIIRDAELSLSGGPVWKEAYEKDERLFCIEVLKPLLEKMGFESIRYIHGDDEYGRDFIFIEKTKFGWLQFYGLQAKAGDLSGEANSEIDKLLGQIDDAFSMPYRPLDSDTRIYISVLVIAISGHFTRNAKEKIKEKMRKKDIIGPVHFLDQDDIRSLIHKYWSSETLPRMSA